MTEFLIFIILYSSLDAFHDYAFIKNLSFQLLKQEYRIWHSIDAIIKLLVVTAIAYFSVFPIISLIVDVFYLTFIFASIRWIVFDLTYNLISGNKWWYVGTGATDIIFRQWQFYLKLISLYFTIIFILQYYG